MEDKAMRLFAYVRNARLAAAIVLLIGAILLIGAKADAQTVRSKNNIEKEIQQGANLAFTLLPEPPLPRVAGGYFEVFVSVAAFAEVIQQRISEVSRHA
jgi:hypothetical protein